jgi:hypothetical protein
VDLGLGVSWIVCVGGEGGDEDKYISIS